MAKFRLALVQLAVGTNKNENISRAVSLVNKAVSEGASVVALPECFNSPYGTNFFPEYAEDISAGSSPSCMALSKCAKENKVHIIGGSIPEKDGDKLYNTSLVFGPSGEILAKHRKVHLFDIEIPGKIRFKESETLSPGNSFTTFNTPHCKFGVGICYDIRFAEMALAYRDMGCKVLVYPGAFNMTTGPAHWEALIRSRALDNQVYVAAVSPARDDGASYVAWGHSTTIDPWGKVVAKAVISRLEEDLTTSKEEAERTAENRVKRMQQKYQTEASELEASERAALEKYNEMKSRLMDVESNIESLKMELRGKNEALAEAQQGLERLKTERSHVSEIIRQEFADRIVGTEEENKRLRQDMNEMKARHRHELDSARDHIQRTIQDKDEELEEVHKRVKTAIVKKEETVNVMRDQYQAALKRADHLEGLLEQQRMQMLGAVGSGSTSKNRKA